jgi:hypothetical protein
MYFTNDEIEFNWNFNNGISCWLKGKKQYYFFQLSEIVPWEKEPVPIIYFNFFSGTQYHHERLFYDKYKIDIFDWDENGGLINIFSYEYNDRNQNVYFDIRAEFLEDAQIWYDQVQHYISISGCIPTYNSKFNHELGISNPVIGNDFYKEFYIGRFPQINPPCTDQFWEESCDGLYRRYWSLKNPRDWNTISCPAIAQDILGLTEFYGRKKFILND